MSQTLTQQEGFKKLTLDQKIQALIIAGWMLDKDVEGKGSNISNVKWVHRNKKVLVLIDVFPFIQNNKLDEIKGKLKRVGLEDKQVQFVGVLDSCIKNYNETILDEFFNKTLSEKWTFVYDIQGHRSADIIKQMADEYFSLRKDVITVCDDPRFAPLTTEGCMCLDHNLNLVEGNGEYFTGFERLKLRKCKTKPQIKVWINTLIRLGLFS